MCATCLHLGSSASHGVSLLKAAATAVSAVKEAQAPVSCSGSSTRWKRAFPNLKEISTPQSEAVLQLRLSLKKAPRLPPQRLGREFRQSPRCGGRRRRRTLSDLFWQLSFASPPPVLPAAREERWRSLLGSSPRSREFSSTPSMKLAGRSLDPRPLFLSSKRRRPSVSQGSPPPALLRRTNAAMTCLPSARILPTRMQRTARERESLRRERAMTTAFPRRVQSLLYWISSTNTWVRRASCCGALAVVCLLGGYRGGDL